MSSHTPGPWRLGYGKFAREIVGPNDEDIGLVNVTDGEANASLILAATDLLAACKKALAILGSDQLDSVFLLAHVHGHRYAGPSINIDELRQAIAKAEAAPASAGGQS